MKVVLVDDEPPGRLAIRQHLAALPDAEIVAECGDGGSAVEAILQHAPDVLFLDVQLGGVSGLDVLERVGADAVPAIVFVTAYDRYAVRAFEAHAVDYLLKPIDPDRFVEAWHRAASRVELERDEPDRRVTRLLEDEGGSAAPLDRFVVRGGGRLVLVPVDSVEWIEAAGNYVRLHQGGEEHLVRRTLSELTRRLGNRFIRIRRTALVNAQAITALEPYGKGSYVVHIRGGTRLISSRYAGRALRSWLKG
ncbi:MAG TPA: LytTR family DNA-binding domain-containing protein [Gemmatimonadales bacterium]|nr:LytTR family DNA-binding domain-containing protein [Gemmatimonadales bacterium]